MPLGEGHLAEAAPDVAHHVGVGECVRVDTPRGTRHRLRFARKQDDEAQVEPMRPGGDKPGLEEPRANDTIDHDLILVHGITRRARRQGLHHRGVLSVGLWQPWSQRTLADVGIEVVGMQVDRTRQGRLLRESTGHGGLAST